ncbi:unnamed protein product [Anisakis simplex]|uniref:Polyphosphate kinase n=1 Tax=Anisakis simplex TaxID=6269 RepID=A0A0M3JQK7_ANISI|nr:unnamed protein product [Anisakis simplex]
MNNRIETFISERSNERSELMDDMGDELVFRLPIDMDAKDLKRYLFSGSIVKCRKRLIDTLINVYFH